MAIEVSKNCAVGIIKAIPEQTQIGVTASTPSKIVIYDGTIPENPDVDVSTGILASFNLPNPAFSESTFANGGGYIALNATPPVQASATGTASFFRLLNGEGKCVCQGTVTDTTGTGDVLVSSTKIISQIDVTIVSFTFLYPAYLP